MDLSKSFKNFNDLKWLPYVEEFLDQMAGCWAYYVNTAMQYATFFYGCQMKSCDISLMFAQRIGSNEHQNIYFWEKNEK